MRTVSTGHKGNERPRNYAFAIGGRQWPPKLSLEAEHGEEIQGNPASSEPFPN